MTHICGDGDLRPDLEEYVRNHQLGGNVMFHGFIDENEKADYLASADLAIYPSTGGEAFGIVLIEAMATGRCVVLGGDNAGYRTVLGEREELLFDPLDSADLANRIEYFLTDKKLSADAITWQSNEVLKYDVNQIGAEVVGIYKEAIQGKK